MNVIEILLTYVKHLLTESEVRTGKYLPGFSHRLGDEGARSVQKIRRQMHFRADRVSEVKKEFIMWLLVGSQFAFPF